MKFVKKEKLLKRVKVSFSEREREMACVDPHTHDHIVFFFPRIIFHISWCPSRIPINSHVFFNHRKK